jgi:uncharacterized protein (DUF2147 family)
MLTALALALAAPAPAPAAAPAGTDIAGTWRLQNKKALVHIGPCGESWCGKVTKFLKPLPYRKTHDTQNPDPNLRGRSIVGVPILFNLKRDGDKWRGDNYDPVHGKSYRAVVQRDSATTLEVKGCLTIFCKTQIWDKAD